MSGGNQQKAIIAREIDKDPKLLVQYALPAMIAMTASSLYNIVDRVFIGQGVGAMAISGLAIQLPQDVITAGVTPNPRNK